MAITKTLRGYDLFYYDTDTPPYILCKVIDTNLTEYQTVPTTDEIYELFEITPVDVRYDYLFGYVTKCAAFPRIPDGGSRYGTAFYKCTSIIVPPALPKNTQNIDSFFLFCSAMTDAAVIPQGVTRASGVYDSCTSLKWPVSIPQTVTRLDDIFWDCPNVTGEAIIRPMSFTNYSFAFRNTVKPITLYGDQTICQTLAATGNNGNVSWSPWYDPIPAVKNRGEGSRTTAADITRMVRNGALAVSSYAPGRMAYQTGDIVREDEWNALVEAAQTIDPTVTYSTHYANMNKIEAAFDSAL